MNLPQVVKGEKAIVRLRWDEGELSADGELRPGDRVKMAQAGEDVSIIVVYEDVEPTLAQIAQSAGVDVELTDASLSSLRGLPLSDLTVFGIGTILEQNPDLLDQLGIGMLENLADLYEIMPWYLGYLLSIIKDSWEDSGLMANDGLWRRFGGESFDGLAGRLTKRAYKTYIQWVECASLYLRNSESHPWLRQVTVDFIMRNVRMSNAWIAAASVRDHSITVETIAALLSGAPGVDIKHELARRNNGTPPDTVTKDDIEVAIQQGKYDPPPADRDEKDDDKPKQTALDSDWVQHGSDVPQWVYDDARRNFGYWLDGRFNVAFRVVDDSLHTTGMIVRILSTLPIKPSRYRDAEEETELDFVETGEMMDSDEIVAWYYELLEKESSISVRKAMIGDSATPITRITQAVRHHVKCLMLESYDNRCPIDSGEATDLHEVILLRNDAPPLTMLAVNAFNPHNCILVSRATNRKAENPDIRGKLILEMERREYDPIGWARQLMEGDSLKGFHMPKIEGHPGLEEEKWD